MSKIDSQSPPFSVNGQPLSIHPVAQLCRQAGACQVHFGPDLAAKMQVSVDLVSKAVQQNQLIYGVTTGFGGMSEVSVGPEQAAASQTNLLAFLSTGAGQAIDRRHTRAAMLLRANVLARGCSGIRFELVQRLIQFFNAGATPVVREHGSIGASGDLVPLSVIARAITGTSGVAEVDIGDRRLSHTDALAELNLEPISLQPKEGLALVNGTSFSSAIAANCVDEAKSLMALSMAAHAMMMQALMVHSEPFEDFVHQMKPHPGQQWSASMMNRLLKEGQTTQLQNSDQVQDRYSLRCLPQYMGSIVEGMARISEVVQTEMNSVSDNPLIDVQTERFYQSGNFLGQYVAVAMDDLRREIGLMAKHLDVQIATLVAPEFNEGLPASLRGNEAVPYNMGLKGLQITGNSIMPLLTWYGNPIVSHFPTHAEQFNQNINGLSFSSANLAWKSVETFGHYISVALIMSVQALDLRARKLLGHDDGSALLGSLLRPVYEAICKTCDVKPTSERPFVFNDSEGQLEVCLAKIAKNLGEHGTLIDAVSPILKSFDDRFGTQDCCAEVSAK
ncbi:MAG: aromatic amino acid ammonia-lyase [Fuerstiella sp.]